MSTHFLKDGRPFTVSKPDTHDAADLIDYAKTLFASTDQVLTTLAEYTVTTPQEERWIQQMNENPNALVLVAKKDDAIVGMLFFIPGGRSKTRHTGEFGVNVHPDFQAKGIGTVLVQCLLDWAVKHPEIEKVFLTVFHTNRTAIKLYQRLGFKEEGRHINAAKQPSGEYVDVVQMYVETK